MSKNMIANSFRVPFSGAIKRWRRRLDSCAAKKENKNPLENILIDTINSHGPISIERYMEIVLHHKDYGYYSRGNPLGQQGDFGTAPEISQMFGEVIAVWCVDAWIKMGRPDKFILLELGPGQGTLMHDIVRSTENIADFHRAVSLHLMESNVTLRDMQKAKLAPYSPVHIDDLGQLPPLPTIIVANEFFDTIPMRQFVKTRKAWQEILVGHSRNALQLERGQDISVDAPRYMKGAWNNLEQGWVYEMSPQSDIIMKQLAAHISRYKGAGLFIDYGYAVPDGVSTLDAWRRHKHANILDNPGRADVTAGVNFAALQSVIREESPLLCKVVSQKDFLIEWGIGVRVNILLEQNSSEKRKHIQEELYRLTSPSQMGERWLAMTIGAD